MTRLVSSAGVSGCTLICVAALLGLTACQPVRDASRADAPQLSASGQQADAAAGPPALCASGLRAALVSGLIVDYAGSLPTDTDMCLVRWQGHSHRYYLGFWGSRWFDQATASARRAIQHVVNGPAGTEVSFPLNDEGGFWRRATVTHLADSRLTVAGKERATVELRIVRDQGSGRSGEQAESLYWIDRNARITLRREIVNAMADGERQRIIIWQVREILPDSTESEG